VREYVVHLLGDPGALTQPGLLAAQLALGLGPLGPVPQRHHQVAAGADVRADRDPGPDQERPAEYRHPELAVAPQC
jgi:hypothetical protein